MNDVYGKAHEGDYLPPLGKYVFALFIIMGAALLFFHAGNYYLWEDEGETALLGRNVMRYGLPYGFDGRNLYEFRGGLCLNREFLPALTPWLQFYWAALSMAVFGESTFGARALFIGAGSPASSCSISLCSVISRTPAWP
jgi:hypothetical protein